MARLAVLAAFDLAETVPIRAVVTFGAPRVGMFVFRHSYNTFETICECNFAMNPFRKALESGLNRLRFGDPGGALAEFRPALTEALAANENVWASLLARNAALSLEQLGDTTGALALLEETSLVLEPHARDLYAMGQLARKIGDTGKARRYLQDCRRRCQGEGDADLLELLNSVTGSG